MIHHFNYNPRGWHKLRWGAATGWHCIGPANAARLPTIEPIVTVLLAARLFSEVLKTKSLIGGALILIAVLLLARGELQRPDRSRA